jgi:MFS family permease
MGLYNWRMIISGTAVVTFLVCAGIWVFVRNTPREKGYVDFQQPGTTDVGEPQTGIIGGIMEVFRYRNTWLLCVIPGGPVGAVLTFSGLWGVPYLSTHHNLSTAGASALATTLLVAFAVAGPVFGWLSDYLGHRKSLYIIGCAVSLFGWSAILLTDGLPMTLFIGLLIITGFSSGCMIVTFALAKESVPVRLAGTVSGIVNMGLMTGPMVLQPAVGWILDQKWKGQITSNVRVYPIEAYQSGFAPLLAWLALSFILLFFTRETHCRQLNHIDAKASRT